MGSFIYQAVCTGIACYICMSVGIMLTWPSSTLKIFQSTNTTLNRPMAETELALFGSLSSFGALLGTPIAGYLLDVIGRKYCCLAASMTHVIAWTLIVSFNYVEVVLAAIFISGAGAAVILIVPVFISEICQESIRGTMTSGTLIFYAVGMLVSYLLGGCLQYRTMVYVCTSISAAGVLMVMFLRETPMFLMKKGLEEEAAKSFAFYRGEKVDSKEVRREMDTLRRVFNPVLEDGDPTPEEEKLKPTEVLPQEKVSLLKFFRKSRTTRKAFFITLVLCSAAVFQGLVVLQVYAEPLFSEAVPSMSSTLCSVIFAAVTIVSGLTAAYLTDLAGRRPLIIYSSMVAGVSCVGLGAQLQFHWAPHWVTAVFIYLFTVSYNTGAGIVPFVLLAEIFLPEVKSFMSMFVMEWAWLCNFTILFIFNPLVTAMGLGPVFYLFAIVCFLTAAFSIIFVPETKGLPLDAIQLLLSKKR